MKGVCIYYLSNATLWLVAQYSVWLWAGRPGDRGLIPGRSERIFPLASVQTGSGAYPTSCTMGTGGPLAGAKVQPGRDACHSPSLVPRLRMGRSYTSSPTKRLCGVQWGSFSSYPSLL
jgi:hypothetical protein